MMIIGVTGLMGSGKGAVADILIEKGFVKLGHSESIDEELQRRGLACTRENQVAVANEMRQKQGSDYLAKKLLEKIEPTKNYVIEGFRNVAEIEVFRNRPDFILIGVAAGRKRRFEWLRIRDRLGDPKTKEEFEKVEKRDFLQQAPYGQQNALCFALAERYFLNEGNFEELKKQVEEFLRTLAVKNTTAPQ